MPNLSSTKFYVVFHNHQREIMHRRENELLSIKQDVVTRWNSTYYLLKSAKDTKPALVQTLNDIENPPVEFNRKDWDLIDQVLSVLAPFEEATRDLSNHDASISMTIPTITIIDSLQVGDEDHGVKGLKRSLKASMEARFCAVEAYEHFTIASFLDVKYKDQFF